MSSPNSTQETVEGNARQVSRLRPLYEKLLFPWRETTTVTRTLSPREQWEALTGKKLDDPSTIAEMDALVARMQAATQNRSDKRG